jgi:hypothetical protein
LGVARKHRQFVARILLAAFVFAQGAVSAYACPELAGPGSAPASAEAMPDCDQMNGLDPSAPNLCLAHCQSGLQSFDHSPQPAASPAVVPALVVFLPDVAASETSSRACNTLRLTAAAPPPHSILHCCFRI